MLSNPQNDPTEHVRAEGVDSGGESSEAVPPRVTPLQVLVQRLPGGSGSVPTRFLYQTDGNVHAFLWKTARYLWKIARYLDHNAPE